MLQNLDGFSEQSIGRGIGKSAIRDRALLLFAGLLLRGASCALRSGPDTSRRIRAAAKLELHATGAFPCFFAFWPGFVVASWGGRCFRSGLWPCSGERFAALGWLLVVLGLMGLYNRGAR
jgi:hypothetical protein